MRGLVGIGDGAPSSADLTEEQNNSIINMTYQVDLDEFRLPGTFETV